MLLRAQWHMAMGKVSGTWAGSTRGFGVAGHQEGSMRQSIEFGLLVIVTVVIALVVASQIGPAVEDLWDGIAYELGQALR